MTGYRGSGGPNGDRVWWPAGLAEMTPAERVHALAHGWWYDGLDIVTRDGRRLSPVSTALSTQHDDFCPGHSASLRGRSSGHRVAPWPVRQRGEAGTAQERAVLPQEPGTATRGRGI